MSKFPSREEREEAADRLASAVSLWFGGEGPDHGTPECQEFVRDMIDLANTVLTPTQEEMDQP